MAKNAAREEVDKALEKHMPVVNAEARKVMAEEARALVTRYEFEAMRKEQAQRHEQIMGLLQKEKGK